MIKILIVFAIMLLLAAPATAANVTKVEIRGVVFDSGSSTYNTTLQWDAQKFPGFWYAPGGGKSSESLKIINQPASSLTINNRVIEKGNLQYNTTRSDQKFKVFSEKNRKVENGLEYNSTAKTFKPGTAGGYYARLGWFGDLYIAVNGKANKLAKLVKEQKAEEKKTLKLGTSWDLGEGYNLTVQSLDTATNPRQAWLSLSKDGKTFDNRVVNEGEVYTYIEKSVGGESSVPVFVTYVESIFTGAEGMSTFVQLRYTWLISLDVLEIKAGDKFGVFEVKEANENYVLLDNKDNPITLGQNSVQSLFGNLSFKVADSSTALRFYPILEKTAPGKYEIHGMVFDSGSSTYNTTLQWDAQKFPGFWYAPGGGKSSESLKIINQPASSLTVNNRVIEKEKLQYNTTRSDQKFKVFSEKNRKVENGLEYNSTAKTFKPGTTGGYYARLGWFGDLYVAVNGKANKLAKLIKEQKAEEKKTLKLGTSWDLGEGYNLTVQSLDTATNPRQAWLSLSKDNESLDYRVVKEGEVYTYIEKSVGGESSVPVFVTYVESIFTGTEGMSTFIQLRYTWLISRNVLEIKAGDKFGVFEVKEANENYVLLDNKDNPITLGQNSVQPLYGELKFKVADSSTALRFYPLLEYSILEPKVEAKAQPVSPQPTTTAASSAVVSEPLRATAPVNVQTTQTEKPLTSTALPEQWNWIFFAVAGLIGTGYLILRKG
ncbi:MAG: hypothetical protein FIB07_04180 [Candidatus Methanoperedens sp.]|nr:hypothetical protein [Candidatus Methanoperedens sp.]